MCGYCMENIYALELYRKIKGDNLEYHPLVGPLYLQEQEDISQVINKLRHEWDLKDLHQIIHCCNIHNRFFPKNNGHFQELSSGLEGVKDISSYEFIIDDSREVMNTIPVLNKAVWIDLYRPETVIDNRLWRKFAGNNDLINASKEILEHYIDWWLKGTGKKKNDFEKIHKQTGISNSLNDVDFNEGEKFFILLPVFYFSLFFLASHKIEDDLIEFIATNNPARTPGFPGYDLWLQRTALHLCIQNKGINSIKSFWQKVRFVMIYIELIKCYRSDENADKLIRIIQDYFSFLSDKSYKYPIDYYDNEDQEDSHADMLRNLESEILYS